MVTERVGRAGWLSGRRSRRCAARAAHAGGRRPRWGRAAAPARLGQGAVRTVPLGDLGAQPAFVAGRRVGSAQCRPVQQPIESCLGDVSQVLALTSREIQVEPGQGSAARGTRQTRRGGRSAQRAAGWRAQGAAAAPAPTTPQPVGERKPHGRSPGQPRLRTGNHRVVAGPSSVGCLSSSG